MREIKSLIDQGAIGGLSFELTYYMTVQYKREPMYMLDFDATMTLGIGYEAKNTQWFVAKDVAVALNDNVRTAHIPELWRGVESVSTDKGRQEMAIISEAGLYFFLNRSDKPAAMPMQKLVSGEILPSIRKSGTYGQPAIDVKNKPVTLLPIDRELRAARMATGLR